MAMTFGQLTAQILTDTNRDGSAVDPNYGNLPLYPCAIQRAINTAIKYMESRFYWMFRTSAVITIPQGGWFTDLPANFCNMDTVQYTVGPIIYGRKVRFLGVPFEDLVDFFSSENDCGNPVAWAIKSDIENGEIVNRFYVYPNILLQNTTFPLNTNNPILVTDASSILTVTYAPAVESNFFIGQEVTIQGAVTPIGGITNINTSGVITALTSTTLSFDNMLQLATSTATGGGNNVTLTAQNPNGGVQFTVWYYYKDVTYPTVDGQITNPGTSIWFNDSTIDLIRMKAMERFYYDTLQAPDVANGYSQQVAMFEANLEMKNQNKQLYNLLST